MCTLKASREEETRNNYMKTETDAAQVYVEGSIARETISTNVAIWVGIIVHQSQFSFFIGGRVRIIS